MPQQLPPPVRRLWRKLFDKARTVGWHALPGPTLGADGFMLICQSDTGSVLRVNRTGDFTFVPWNCTNEHSISHTPQSMRELMQLARLWFGGCHYVTFDVDQLLHVAWTLPPCVTIAGLVSSAGGEDALSLTGVMGIHEVTTALAMRSMWNAALACPESGLIRNHTMYLAFDAIGFSDLTAYTADMDMLFDCSYAGNYSAHTLQPVFHEVHMDNLGEEDIENVEVFVSRYGIGVGLEHDGVNYHSGMLPWDGVAMIQKILEGDTSGQQQESTPAIVVTAQRNDTPGFAPQQHVADHREVS